MSAVSRAPQHVQRQDVMTTVGQGKVRGVGPTMSLNRDSKSDRQKTDRVSTGEAP
uniref:Uncharacterized protein n=1 Tax=Peronospora matthiolae TaxID=2874970 RepID=A0AAV1UPQ6_9STRA